MISRFRYTELRSNTDGVEDIWRSRLKDWRHTRPRCRIWCPEGSRFGSWRQFWVSFPNMQRQTCLEETLLTLKPARTTYPSIHFPSRPESIVKLIKVCSLGLYILQTCMYIYASWKDRIEFTIGWMLFDNGSKDSEDMQDIKVKLLSLLKGKINSAY